MFSIENRVKSEEWVGRFWDKVDSDNPDGCWDWIGTVDKVQGYGRCWVYLGKVDGKEKSKNYRAHRIAYWLTSGENPKELCVLHKCDNRKCCKPSHLFLGTIQDNNRDRDSKGHTAKGESHGMVKLGQTQVDEIRELSEIHNMTSSESLAKRFNVSQSQINRIINGSIWKLEAEGK